VKEFPIDIAINTDVLKFSGTEAAQQGINQIGRTEDITISPVIGLLPWFYDSVANFLP
tara:strand:- start:1747 stop:1920 length:174 start_codon:yes stop_codon:yes gene_type:complete